MWSKLLEIEVVCLPSCCTRLKQEEVEIGRDALLWRLTREGFLITVAYLVFRVVIWGLAVELLTGCA